MSNLDLELILGGLDSFAECKVSVKRVAPAWAAENLGTIEIYDSMEIDEETIRSRFGGGTYYLKVRKNNGQYLAHRTVTIAGDSLVHNCQNGLQGPPLAKADPYSQKQILDAIQALTAKINDIEMYLSALLQRR